MPCFRKKAPPMWFTLKPSRPGTTTQPTREGPYSRETIASMYINGMLANGVLIWTNERIFPNPNRHRSRPVKNNEWRRIDQIPDPVVKKLEQLARQKADPTTDVIQNIPQQLHPPLPSSPQFQQPIATGPSGIIGPPTDKPLQNLPPSPAAYPTSNPGSPPPSSAYPGYPSPPPHHQ